MHLRDAERRSDVVVHIGFPRTGTSALQAHFFPRLNGCVFLTHSGPGSAAYRSLMENLYHADDATYLRATIRAYLDETRRQQPGTLVISDEALSGATLVGAYNWERNALRLHDLLPEAKILVTVRHQGTRLRSIYNNFLTAGGYGSFREFIENRTGRFRYDLDQMRYECTVARYQDLFGVDRVKVIPYEFLVGDPGRCLDAIASWVVPGSSFGHREGFDTENRSLSPPARWMLRRANRLFLRSWFNPDPLVAAVPGARKLRGFLQQVVDPILFGRMRRRLSSDDEELLRSLLPRYEASNRRLEELTGLSLREYGYPLPDRGRATALS